MQPASSVFRLLRQTVPRLGQDATFVCRRCVQSQASLKQTPTTVYKSTKQTPFLQAFRSPSHPTSIGLRHNSTSPSLSQVGQALGKAGAEQSAKKSFLPETSSKSVAYFLLGSAASVFGIVVFGGLTRLTESGLSITEWRPVTGSLPPTTTEKWEAEFALYRASPEFKLLNSRMDLEEFKQIYWMEWIHRLWGRVVGISFLLPTIYFVSRRRVSAPMARNLTAICGLIAFQGFIGWWMVKSGLKDDLFAPGSHPRVSQYRLAAHLGTAFVCYLAMVWNGISILREHRLLANPAESQKLLAQISRPRLRFFRGSVAALCALVFVTAMSGALVAGLDAGLIYNEFPYMGLGLTPPKAELFDKFYSHTPDNSDLWWRNMLENPSLVQLDHRILATTTFTSVIALFAYARLNPSMRALLTRDAQKGVLGLVHLASIQVILGISALIYFIPTPVASAHQAGALALLTGATVLGRRVWISKRAAKLVAKRLSSSAAPLRSSPLSRGPDAMLRAQTGLAN
ncbi:hypothetical protein AAFC00_000533 [Neodothiora populina]|uniref:Uncharacterized protein n=1 Tax=Neodothiora populina TaxID=2781224 RepID=A0ABR3PD75_9PEZI